jgi:hypothetical protein
MTKANNVQDLISGKQERIRFCVRKYEEIDTVEEILKTTSLEWKECMDLAESQKDIVLEKLIEKSVKSYDIEDNSFKIKELTGFIPNRCTYEQFEEIIIKELGGRQEKMHPNKIQEIREVKKKMKLEINKLLDEIRLLEKTKEDMQKYIEKMPCIIKNIAIDCIYNTVVKTATIIERIKRKKTIPPMPLFEKKLDF